MADLELDYTRSDRDANGNERWYFVREGQSKVRLNPKGVEIGSADFFRRYDLAKTGKLKGKPKRKKLEKQTLGWLIEEYITSPEFTSLAISTQTGRRRILLRVQSENGDLPMDITTRTVRNSRRKRAETPAAANEFVKFENQGYVYLGSLTELPEGVKFENQGSVDLRSLTSEQQTYRDQTIRLKIVDGYTMLIVSERVVGNVVVYRARYFGGGHLSQVKACHLANVDEHWAHGDTLEQAMRDVRFKHMQSDFDAEDLVEEIRASGKITFNQYRLLTGACESGLRHGLEDMGLSGDLDEMPIEEALSRSSGKFGGEVLARMFEEAV